MKKNNILLIEDDETTALLLSDYLNDCGFNIEVVFTATDGISYINQNSYDIVLLDLNLPDFDGFEILKKIKNNISLPVIIISAYSEPDTIVKAFKFGASDYVVKPIVVEVLEARIWSLLGRNSQIMTIKEKRIFFKSDNDIIFNENTLDLTSTEFEILSLLIENKNQVLKRESLSKSLSTISSIRSLDHHIKNIRKKIEKDTSKPIYLKTEYGVGYKLKF